MKISINQILHQILNFKININRMSKFLKHLKLWKMYKNNNN